MREVLISNLKGNEVLGSPVLSSQDKVLLHSGVVLGHEIIERLQAWGIERVYIREDAGAPVSGKVYNVEETQENAKEIVQRVLERHIYRQDGGLQAVGEEAEKIVSAVLEDPRVLTNMTEIRNISTDMYSHCINVCALSTIMALRLKMSERQVYHVSLGAILHDIGLRYVTVPYINLEIEKKGGQEALDYKKHTIYGYSAVQEEKWIPDEVKEIILLHHERENGSGYPFQQTKDRLRTEIKLVAVCDAFDSMISGIGNQKMKIYEAIEYIRVNSGILYEPGVAARLLSSVAAYPVGMKVLTNEGEAGVVFRQNEVTDRPVLKMLYHSDGTPYEEDTYKDLMRILTLFIVDTIE